MMGPALSRNIGSILRVVTSVNPANQAAGTINGAAIDRAGQGGKNFSESCVLKVSNGAASGAPTSRSVDGKLQDSPDGSTGWADIPGAAVSQITADNTDAQVDVDLSGAKRFIRSVVTVAFVGGTSPATPVAAEVVLGPPMELPV
jgi:hypothetical protein